MPVAQKSLILASNSIQWVRLPHNKKLRALRAVHHLLTAHSVTYAALEEVLGFLSHCCQVIPLGRPFLRGLFALLRRNKRRPFLRTRIPSSAKKDINWWVYFLSSWSSVSIIRLSRTNHDAATDASGVKGIGGVFSRRVFSDRIPGRHRQKHINWKETFAILHAFVLFHKQWAGGRLHLACDNTAVVHGINKRSIKGEAIHPLQTILLIAAVFDIEVFAFWIPSEENIVADAASRHDFKKLADLGLQVFRNADIKISTLRHKLFTFLTTHSHPLRGRTMIPPVPPMNLSAISMATFPSLQLSSQSHTGSQKLCGQRNRTRRRAISRPYMQPMSTTATIRLSSTTNVSISSSEVESGSMAKGKSDSAFPSQHQSSVKSSTKSERTTTVSTSKQHYVLRLPDSFDLENLRGIPQ